MGEAIELGFFLIEKIVSQIEKRKKKLSPEAQAKVRAKYNEVVEKFDAATLPESWKEQPLGE